MPADCLIEMSVQIDFQQEFGALFCIWRLTQGGAWFITPTTGGPMAEWLCSGLQNRVHRFNSGSGLHLLFPLCVFCAQLFHTVGITAVS